MLQKQVMLSKTKHKPCHTELRLKLCRKILNKKSCQMSWNKN